MIQFHDYFSVDIIFCTNKSQRALVKFKRDIVSSILASDITILFIQCQLMILARKKDLVCRESMSHKIEPLNFHLHKHDHDMLSEYPFA